MMVPIQLQLLTFHVDKTWSGPLMDQTQHTSKMVGSGPKVPVEIDTSLCALGPRR